MKTNAIFLVGLFLIGLAACNNSNQNKVSAIVVTPEDSSAFETKVSSEDLQQQAEDLDKEVDSLVNSLN